MTRTQSPTATSPLRLAFIGGGISSSIGPSHRAACRLDGRWELVAGHFSRQPETSKATADAWHIDKDRAYPSLEAFIAEEKERVDAVAVLAPTPNHRDIILALHQAGIPVISEKPMVSNLDEAMEIRAAYHQDPGFLAVTFNYSGYPMVRELRARIAAGEFGAIRKLHFEMPQEGFMRLDPATGQVIQPHGWRLVDGRIPVICLDLGVHLHHLAHFLTGKCATRTSARFSNHSIHDGLVDDVMMWLDYEDGMTGSFWMSKSALGHRNGLRLRVYGVEASAEWFQSHPEEMILSRNDGSRVIMDRASPARVSAAPRYNRYRAGHPAGFQEAFANLYGDIADALIAGDSPGPGSEQFVFGIDHSVDGLRMFEAAVEADATNSWVQLSDS